MATDAIVPLQASSVPIRAGNVPKDTGFSEPAIMTTALRPATPLSNSRMKVSRARSLFSQNSRHSIVRNDASSGFFAQRHFAGVRTGRGLKGPRGFGHRPRIDAEPMELRPRERVRVGSTATSAGPQSAGA